MASQSGSAKDKQLLYFMTVEVDEQGEPTGSYEPLPNQLIFAKVPSHIANVKLPKVLQEKQKNNSKEQNESTTAGENSSGGDIWAPLVSSENGVIKWATVTPQSVKATLDGKQDNAKYTKKDIDNTDLMLTVGEGQNFHLVRDADELLFESIEFFTPPQALLNYAMAAAGPNWAKAINNVLKDSGITGNKVTKRNVKEQDIFTLPAEEQLNDDNQGLLTRSKEQRAEYRVWRKELAKNHRTGEVYGFVFPRFRGVVVLFSDQRFERATVKAWPKHLTKNQARSSKKDIEFFPVRLSADPNDPIYLTAQFKSKADLKAGLYQFEIDLSRTDYASKGQWHPTIAGSEQHKIDGNNKYNLLAYLDFDINTPVGDISIVNGDPVALEEVMVQQCPEIFGHILRHAMWADKEDVHGRVPSNIAKKVLTGLDSAVHATKVGKTIYDTVGGFATAGDRWSYGMATLTALKEFAPIPENSATFKAMEAILDINDLISKGPALFKSVQEWRNGTLTSTVLQNRWINEAGFTSNRAAYRRMRRMGLSRLHVKLLGHTTGGIIKAAAVLDVINKTGDLWSTGKAIHHASKNRSQAVNQLHAINEHYHKITQTLNDLSSCTANYVEKNILTQKDYKAILKDESFLSGQLALVGTQEVKLNVVFPQDKDEIYQINGKSQLGSIHAFAKAVMHQCSADTVVTLKGYASTEGEFEYNQKLSERRVANVKAKLIEYGVPADKLHIIGYGETLPIRDKQGEENKVLSRRVEAVARFYNSERIPIYHTFRQGSQKIHAAILQSIKYDKKVNEELGKFVSTCIDLVMVAASFTPIGFVVVNAITVIQLAGKVADKATTLFGPAQDMADRLCQEGYFSSKLDKYASIYAVEETSYANQLLLKESIEKFYYKKQEIIKHNVKQNPEKGEELSRDSLRIAKYFLDIQYRLRFEAIQGLVGLLKRAAIESDSQEGYIQELKKLKVDLYINKYIMNDNWLYPMDLDFPVSLDEFWMQGVAEYELREREEKGERTWDSWVAHEVSDAWGGTKEFFHRPLVSMRGFFNSAFNDVDGSVRAEFQRVFPVHYFSAEDTWTFAKTFRTDLSEITPEDYEYANVYWRPYGSNNKTEWQKLYKNRDKDGDLISISPLDQIRIIVVMKDRQDIKEALAVPFKLQLKRVDGIWSADGPIYDGFLKTLNEDVLLDNEKFLAGKKGAIIMPYYQLGNNVVFGTKPMTGNFQKMERYFVNDSSPIAKAARHLFLDEDVYKQYQLGILGDMNYEFTIEVANQSTSLYHISIYKRDLYHWLTRLKTGEDRIDDYKVSIDVNKKYGDVYLEKLFLHKKFLTSSSYKFEYPPLFDGNITCVALFKIGKNNPYFMLHDSFVGDDDIPGMNEYKVRGQPLIFNGTRVRIPDFDWSTSVEVVLLVACDKLTKNGYLEIKHSKSADGSYEYQADRAEQQKKSWTRIPISFQLAEASRNPMILGPVIGERLHYLGHFDGDLNWTDSEIPYDPERFSEITRLLATGTKDQKEAMSGQTGLFDFLNERHVFACHHKFSYTAPTGKKINSLRPFGKTDFANRERVKLGKDGILNPNEDRDKADRSHYGSFFFTITNIQTPDLSGVNIQDISEDGEGSSFFSTPTRLQVPRPWNYFSGVPWIQMDQDKIDEAIKRLQENKENSGKHRMTVEMEWILAPKEKREKLIKDWIEKEVNDVNYRIKGDHAI
ncbi:OmpA family protein [Endozoicomonas sp. SM1973]|uniref:OmpA family protein n=1 Tax=Spartinivicinus marinus TaxID=2994442 RepID=A0A853IGH6_9GAMM|nr:OmpA family protein [Spartinivicinus marinus]MCX4027646.1 OmpA family protein [Spartinivicinus marinus]NYZ66656.1 OmpA family protein [Spartinivicinus marinus]